jgi:hypothetical protein
MKTVSKVLAIAAAVLLVGLIVAVTIPMWMIAAGIGMTGGGYAALIAMVVLCFAVGGGLMFLIFFSARKGYDEAAYRATSDEVVAEAGKPGVIRPAGPAA